MTLKRRHLILVLAVAAVIGLYCVVVVLPNLRKQTGWELTVKAIRGLPRERILAAAESFAHCYFRASSGRMRARGGRGIQRPLTKQYISTELLRPLRFTDRV